MLYPMYSATSNIEQPLVINDTVEEQVSPSNWIKESQIKVYDDRVIIEIENAEWAKFTDTNSMDPTIDSEANAIEIIPANYEEVHIGDIISYEIPQVNGTIIHRIINTSFDDNGWYAVAKGDNLNTPDPYKIRFHNIKRIVVAIIY